MLLNPEAQRRAQREIDEVVGRDRLPTFADRENLPYTQCVMQEVMRYTNYSLSRIQSHDSPLQMATSDPYRDATFEYFRRCLRRDADTQGIRYDRELQVRGLYD